MTKIQRRFAGWRKDPRKAAESAWRMKPEEGRGMEVGIGGRFGTMHFRGIGFRFALCSFL